MTVGTLEQFVPALSHTRGRLRSVPSRQIVIEVSVELETHRVPGESGGEIEIDVIVIEYLRVEIEVCAMDGLRVAHDILDAPDEIGEIPVDGRPPSHRMKHRESPTFAVEIIKLLVDGIVLGPDIVDDEHVSGNDL